ncbi:hypothetical protein PCASD_25145 [Puccinia coronata f. sp. avenae]|uniref:Uncharacterized protein n=1 Tax=Puccinia coronata f. sp. avenae TaxID=200324 RepID=A0A2N5SI36_9BASI|nr:hypothetical protein PCASD_25145 [Puccinia coronata f. sp. avenae]
MQFYHVSSRSSILECEQWCPVSKDPFVEAQTLYRRLKADSCGDIGPSPSGGTFIEASNMSVQEILDGHSSPLLSGESRMKPEMVMEFAQRLRFSPDDKDNEMLAGRLGVESVLAGTRGNVFLRGVNVLCAKAQQVLLDSHRAGVAEATGRNLVEDLVQGSNTTLLSVNTVDSKLIIDSGYMEWGVNTETEYVALVKSELLTKDVALKCLALSTPVGLSTYREARLEQGATAEAVMQKCLALSERAVHIVCVQTGVSISREEGRALAWMFSYDCVAHKHPVTHKYGGAARDLRPFVTLLNVHFGTFPGLCSDGSFDSYSSMSTMSENLAFGGQFC